MIKQGVENMPKKGTFDEKLSYLTDDGNRMYESQKKAFKKYESKFEQIKIRLPEGSRKIIQDYIDSSDKYESVADLLRQLLEREIGVSFDYTKD